MYIYYTMLDKLLNMEILRKLRDTRSITLNETCQVVGELMYVFVFRQIPWLRGKKIKT